MNNIVNGNICAVQKLLCFQEVVDVLRSVNLSWVWFYFIIVGKLTALLLQCTNLVRKKKANYKFSQIADQATGIK